MSPEHVASDLDEIRAALRWACQHLSLQDQANAARLPSTRRPEDASSPLTAALTDALASVERLRAELTPEETPLQAARAALAPGASLRTEIDRLQGSAPQPVTVAALRNLPAVQAWALGNWQRSGAEISLPGPPGTCAWDGVPRVCCVYQNERPLCAEALVALGVEDSEMPF